MSPQCPVLLIVVNSPNFFLSHRLPVAIAAKEAGYDVHVATMPSPAVGQILAHGLSHHCLPMTRSGINPWSEFRTILAMYRLFRLLRPMIVHLVTIKPVIYGGIAARLAQVPAAVFAISGLGHIFNTNNLISKLWISGMRPLYKAALGHRNNVVIFQNAEDQDALVRLAGINRQSTKVIKGSGVDLKDYHPTPEPIGALTAVYAGRLLWTKGVGEFVKAARAVRQKNPTARFLVAGDIDTANPASLKQSDVQVLSKEGTVEMLGNVANVPVLFSNAHVIVFPSYYGEGVPKTLLEAAACGRPIITTDHPGCRDVVEHGITGLLVPIRNEHDLANAISTLFADSEKRQRMGLAARQKAEREFSIQNVVKRHLAIYRDIETRSAPNARHRAVM